MRTGSFRRREAVPSCTTIHLVVLDCLANVFFSPLKQVLLVCENFVENQAMLKSLDSGSALTDTHRLIGNEQNIDSYTFIKHLPVI